MLTKLIFTCISFHAAGVYVFNEYCKWRKRKALLFISLFWKGFYSIITSSSHQNVLHTLSIYQKLGNLSMRTSPAVGDDLSQQEPLWEMLEAETEDAEGVGFIFAGKWNSTFP